MSNGINNNTHVKRRNKQHPPAQQERMEVDNVIYISDLESDSESDTDEKVIFISDIEKKLNKIPYTIANRDLSSKGQPTSTELVLYSIPSSISVPEQKDVVKRAIIESRERLRKQGESSPNIAVGLSTFPGNFTRRPNGTPSETPAHVPNDMFNEMMVGSIGIANELVDGWDSWRPIDENVDMRPLEDLDDLDVMEIE